MWRTGGYVPARSFTSLCEFAARDSDLARVTLVVVLAPGCSGLMRRELLVAVAAPALRKQCQVIRGHRFAAISDEIRSLGLRSHHIGQIRGCVGTSARPSPVGALLSYVL